MNIGAQMYTVRDFCKTTDELAETLARIADIGYREVQVSGTCPFEPEWLAEQLSKNGLACVVTHTNPDRIADEPDAVAADHRVFGCGIVGSGCAPGGFAGGFPDYEAFRERCLPAARRLRELGITLSYHNHHFEFARYDGRLLIEHMAADFAPEELAFTLDTYWAQYGGCDPTKIIRQLAGRVPCVHLKDFAIVGREQRMAVVGEGNLDFDAILAACESSGSRHLLVEQDNCYGEDPFACLARSYRFLQAQGLR